jgi:hypothetical protein
VALTCANAADTCLELHARFSGGIGHAPVRCRVALPGIAREDAHVTEPAERLKAEIRTRMALLGMHDWTQLATRSGVKPRTLTNILAGRLSRRREAVELTLEWAPGSIEAILQGGEATIYGGHGHYGDVGAERQHGAVFRRRDDSNLIEIVRELRQIGDQQLRAAERMQRTVGALADELEAEE